MDSNGFAIGNINFSSFTSDSIRQNIVHFGDIFIATLLTIKYFIIMAKVEFPDFMNSVSGTLRTIKFADGTKRKIIVTCSKSGKQRMYLRDYKTRTTPVSDKELKARGKFAEAAQFYSNLTEEQKEAYSQQWRKNKYRLNGKKYSTLRGYIVALFYMGKA